MDRTIFTLKREAEPPVHIVLDYIDETIEVEQRLKPLYNFKAVD